MANQQKIRSRFRITGQVQGVGFRPFVYRLAAGLGLTGRVSNDARGVLIEVQGHRNAVDDFARRLGSELPPLAEIASCDRREIELRAGESDFRIVPSSESGLAEAQVTVDTATCAECLKELFDPADKRYRYPFINCTNCGPRYTIVGGIPYDRPNTTMAAFPMCDFCKSQYDDPADRRFHAQPVACPDCGPQVWLSDNRGRQMQAESPFATAAEILRDGKILAIKGLGGFHLACRGDEEQAVARLRRRKRRDAKPFALMVADLAGARRLCRVSEDAARLLEGPLRPIVIMPTREEADIAAGVAEGLDTLGVMLPYTPVHHLLFAEEAVRELPLVMTSGNLSHEPLVKDNDEALRLLGDIADAFLIHDRPIARRLDDSVAQLHTDGATALLRRARGYAPRPVRLEGLNIADARILAVGAELNNTFCLIQNDRALISEHIGDLTDSRTYRHYTDTIEHLCRLFEFEPSLIAADLHPQYLSSRYATRRSEDDNLPLEKVQHHHAHVAACLGENSTNGPVIGLACDGVGYGPGGGVWGCEILRADLASYRRIGHLKEMPLIGGDAAAVQTWRPALAALHGAFGSDCAERMSACRGRAEAENIHAAMEMLRTGVNCPPTSSLGRLFDAVAWMTGVAEKNRYEGEAPMKLEAAVEKGVDSSYGFEIVEAAGTVKFHIDPCIMVRDIIADLEGGMTSEVIAAKFHNTVAEFLTAAAVRAAEETNLETVAITGGCFANRYLTARVIELLSDKGLKVIRHRIIPPGDGGVALGQAIVAAARIAQNKQAPSQALTGKQQE